MFLLDTNVISELRKARAGKADKRVASWAADVPLPSMFLSVITILELETGVLLVERRDPAQGVILAVDTDVAQRCARLHVPDRRADRDALIAATAQAHETTIATRNVADFEPIGVPTVNPWDYQAGR